TRATAKTAVMAAAAPREALRSLVADHTMTKTTIGSAVSIDPRSPPRASPRRCRIRASTVGWAGSATTGHQLVCRVVDGRHAVGSAQQAGGPEVGPGLDADDAAPTEPDELDGEGAVVEPGDEGGDGRAGAQGHRQDGARDGHDLTVGVGGDGRAPLCGRGLTELPRGDGVVGTSEVDESAQEGGHQRTSVISGPRSKGLRSSPEGCPSSSSSTGPEESVSGTLSGSISRGARGSSPRVTTIRRRQSS